MKIKHTLLYCINLFLISICFGQSKVDSITSKQDKQGFLIGIDLFRPASQLFSDAAGYEIFTAIPIKKKWQLNVALGFESNKFLENNWDVDADGFYGRMGALWFIDQDISNVNNGYYTGGQVAYSHYNQIINSYQINSEVFEPISRSLPKHSANAVWFEPLAGARISLFNTPFYLDASVQLRILLYNKSEKEIEPLVIPGFGRDRNGLNIGLKWGIAYIF